MKEKVQNNIDFRDGKVMYDADGKPEYLLVPLQSEPIYDVSNHDIVKAIDKVREELSVKYNAKKRSSY